MSTPLRDPKTEEPQAGREIQRASLALTVLIPAYNESGTLPQLLEALNGLSLPRPYEILVVDDGSTDNTEAVAAAFPSCRVIRHPYNKGNGAAIKTGLRMAGGERIVIIDADMQHEPANIPLLLEKSKEFDLVVGVRQKGVSPGVRNLGNRLLNRLATYLCGRRIPDLTCGFRAFHREKITRFMHLYPNGFSFSATSTMAAICAGYDVAFVPIEAYPRTQGESKVRLLKDGLRFPALAPDLMSHLRRRYRLVRVLPGSLGDGAMRIYVQEAAAGSFRSARTARDGQPLAR